MRATRPLREDGGKGTRSEPGFLREVTGTVDCAARKQARWAAQEAMALARERQSLRYAEECVFKNRSAAQESSFWMMELLDATRGNEARGRKGAAAGSPNNSIKRKKYRETE